MGMQKAEQRHVARLFCWLVRRGVEDVAPYGLYQGQDGDGRGVL